MLPQIDEKQITWDDMEVKEDNNHFRIEGEPIIIEEEEWDFGPSPIEQLSPLLEALRQFPQQYYRRERKVDWKHVPIITKDAISGVDMAGESLDETQVMEIYRGQITIAFGISKETLEAARAKVNSQLEKGMLHFINVALCTPSRNPITGGE